MTNKFLFAEQLIVIGRELKNRKLILRGDWRNLSKYQMGKNGPGLVVQGILGYGLKPMMQRLPAFFDYASNFKKRFKKLFYSLSQR